MTPEKSLKSLLAAVFAIHNPGSKKQRKANFQPIEQREDFCFHMLDWREDLERLASLYQNPERFSEEEAASVVYGFLIHAVPHLMEAGRILEGQEIANPFR